MKSCTVVSVPVTLFSDGIKLWPGIVFKLYVNCKTCSWQALRQYLVWDAEGESEKHDTVIEDLFEACDCDTDAESTGKRRGSKRKAIKEKKEKKDSEEAVGSQKSESDESSSEDEARKSHLHSTNVCNSHVTLGVLISLNLSKSFWCLKQCHNIVL